MAGSTTPRRSTRERRPPKEVYVVAKPESENDSDNNDDDDEVEPENEELEQSPNRTTKLKQTVSQRRKSVQASATKRLRVVHEGKNETDKTGKTSPSSSDDDPDDENDSSLYEAIRHPNSALEPLARTWVQQYTTDPSTALADLLNFLFQSCGGSRNYVSSSEDILNLEMDGVVQKVMEDLASEDEYPLISKKKEMKRFRSNFLEFWRRLVECSRGDVLYESDLLETLIDWMTALASASSRPIRFTSTLAGLQLGSSLIAEIQECSTEIATQQRQLKVSKKKVAGSTTDARSSQLTKDITLREKRKEALAEHVMEIFKGIFIHRYRDVHEDIRVECTLTIGGWIKSLPEVLFDDQYVKYLGWMLSDMSPLVRRAALNGLKDLYALENGSEKLELFTARFGERVITMGHDEDSKVIMDTLSLLRIMIESGSLEMTQEQLDTLELLVFEENDAALRKEALAFWASQLVAFDDEQAASEPAKRSEDQILAMLDLGERFGDSETVMTAHMDYIADSAWDLKQCDAIKDWDTMAELLSEARRGIQLSAYEQALLVRLYAASLQMACTPPTARLASKAVRGEQEELLEKASIHLVKYLGRVIKVFQADTERLKDLVLLPHKIKLSAYGINRQQKSFKELLTRMRGVFGTVGDQNVLSGLAKSFKHFIANEHPLQREAEQTIEELFSELEESLLAAIDMLHSKNSRAKSPSTKAKQNSKRSATASTGKDDEEFAFSLNVTRLKALALSMNLFNLGSRTSEVLDALKKAVAHMLDLGEVRSCSLKKDKGRLETKAQIVCDGLSTHFASVCWLLRSALDNPQMQNSVDNEKCVAEALEARDCLVQLLEHALALGAGDANKNDEDEDEDEEGPVSAESMTSAQKLYVEAIQRKAFEIVSDLRVLCSDKKNSASKNGDESEEEQTELAWTLSPRLTSLLQHYFSQQMEQEDEKNMEHRQDALVGLAKQVKASQLHRKQAAAILLQISTDNDQTQEIVKNFARGLKQYDAGSYLEVQMTALRQAFARYLRDDLDEDELEVAYDRLIAVSKKLASMIGVGKVSREMEQPFAKFLQEGLRFAVEDAETNFLFLDALRFYLGHARPSDLNILSRKLRELERELPARVLEDIEEQEALQESDRNPAYRAYLSFRQALVGSSNVERKTLISPRVRQVRKRLSLGAVAEEDKIPDDGFKSSRRTGRKIVRSSPQVTPLKDSSFRSNSQLSHQDEDDEESRFELSAKAPQRRSTRLDSDDEDDEPKPPARGRSKITPSSDRKRSRIYTSPEASPDHAKPEDDDSEDDIPRQSRRQRLL